MNKGVISTQAHSTQLFAWAEEFSNQLGKYLEAWLLNCLMRPNLAFVKLAKMPSTVAVPILQVLIKKYVELKKKSIW